MPGWRVLIGMVMALAFEQAASAEDFLAGANLYNDVARYASFGSHRFGSPGDRATADWIAGELQAAGFGVEFQPVILGRQYFVDRASVEVDGATIEATPFWWPPEDKSSFRLTAPVVRDGEAAGKIVWIELPYDRSAYLGPAHRAAIAQAAARGPAAILLVIGNPGDDRFAYNVTQEDPPWPVPVMVVAGKDRGLLERAVASGAAVTLDAAGHYERNVAGRNVVGRIGAGKGPVIVVSTPMTGWYSCVCERGPGIANFLALARTVAAEKLPGNFIFIATAGHEIGHGGMELFLKQGAPSPQDTLAWVHFGASNACYAWSAGPQGFTREDRVDDALRFMVLSPSAVPLVAESFAAIKATRLVAEKQAVGELRDVQAAGYRNFLGMAGLHRFFHTPADDISTTGPEILEPVARAFADAVRKIAERGPRAFE
ncbi:MAG TPA: hypothetical protein VK804_06050 [Bradyrhizobium sp.]|jgi:hypothetical protein|uniref:hypothetical protein n=1 Tax=Bradyrhizobium sp. TaxID=376 RepID=UPI002CB75D0E|nr:hypothetical protein [Bradyrhizobium sp.]HTB00020.1 hypothetical protein [Bradyrhizobium sp.]